MVIMTMQKGLEVAPAPRAASSAWDKPQRGLLDKLNSPLGLEHALRRTEQTSGVVDSKLVVDVAAHGTVGQAQKLRALLRPVDNPKIHSASAPPYRVSALIDRTAELSQNALLALDLAAHGFSVSSSASANLAIRADEPKRIRGNGIKMMGFDDQKTAYIGSDGRTCVLFEDALRSIDAQRRVLISNSRLNRFYSFFLDWGQPYSSVTGQNPLQYCLSVVTGTLLAYETLGKPFGRFVECTDPNPVFDYGYRRRWVLPVPPDYQGITGAALVIEHPHFEIVEDGRNRIIVADKVDLLTDFSGADGWYLPDPVHYLPVGERIPCEDRAPEHVMLSKYLHSATVVSTITFVCRTHHYPADERNGKISWRSILLEYPMDLMSYAAVEEP